jgi:hemolysin III
MLGVGLSIAGLVALLFVAHGRPWHVVAYSIYGATLIALYTASTLYHSIQTHEHGIKRLQRLDYIGIFLLIAGTYTPVCLVALRGTLGWTMFGIEWGIAALGIIATFAWKGAPEWVRVVLYVLMGWLTVIALPAMRAVLPPAALGWLIGGGISYTVGMIVYATDWPHLYPGKFSAHDLWHIFVIGGSACHFVMVLCFVSRLV